MAPVPIIYVTNGDNVPLGYFASRKGARRFLEPTFQKYWAQANDPVDKHYDFVWAKRYRELGEQKARNSFMKAAIWYLNVRP
jgi:hypothetical protein